MCPSFSGLKQPQRQIVEWKGLYTTLHHCPQHKRIITMDCTGLLQKTLFRFSWLDIHLQCITVGCFSETCIPRPDEIHNPFYWHPGDVLIWRLNHVNCLLLSWRGSKLPLDFWAPYPYSKVEHSHPTEEKSFWLLVPTICSLQSQLKAHDHK